MATYGNIIEKFTPGGVGSVFASSSDGLSDPEGLTFDSAGSLYAANFYAGTIEKFTASGVGSVLASMYEPYNIAILVPEPSTFALLGLGAAAVLRIARRRR